MPLPSQVRLKVEFNPEVQFPFKAKADPESPAWSWSFTRLVALSPRMSKVCPAAVQAVMLGVAVTVVVPLVLAEMKIKFV